MKKRLLGVLLVLAMCVMLLPVAAFAAETYPVYIAGTQVTSDNLSGEGWEYDPATETLTLDNAVIEGGSGYGIYANGIDLTVTGTGSVSGSFAICVNTGAALIRKAELDLSGKCGIYADADVVISDGSRVTASGSDYGICGYNELVISDSTVDVVGSYYYGLYAHRDYDGDGDALTIDNSAVTLTDCYADYGLIYATYDGIVISGNSTVTSRHSEDSYYGYSYYGISADSGGVGISGSKVTLENVYYYALYADADAVISENSTVSFTQTEDSYYGYCEYGVYAVGEVSITDSTLNAENVYYYAIYACEDTDGDDVALTVDNSSVTATGEYDYSYSFGIYVDYDDVVISGGSELTLDAYCGAYIDDGGDFFITDSTVTVKETDGDGEYDGLDYGIWVEFGDLIIENSTVEVDAYYYGLYSDYDMMISDSTVTTTGYDDFAIEAEGKLVISGLNSKVTADSSYIAVYAYEGIELGEGVELIEPEGGFYDYSVYDDEGNYALHVVIAGLGEPEEPEPYEEGYFIRVSVTGSGIVTASPEAAGPGTQVTITAAAGAGAYLYEITALDDEGRPVELTPDGNGACTFVMPASDVRVNARFVSDLPFTDVSPDDYFYDAVAYLYNNGITKGTSETTFEPDGTCTRAETVTLLWRMAGEPEPASAGCPFTDVAPGAYYYKAVLWAYENGITLGTSDTTFEPGLKVQRAMTVTFLYRALKLQGEGFADAWAFELDFADRDDVPEWSYESFCWMVVNGIVQGADGKLLPLDPCARGQIAAMLYRTLA